MGLPLLAVAALLGACERQKNPVGADLYLRYCASCHGPVGRGDGPAAAALQPPPADLTRLDLGVADLARRIDGRDPVRAHGTGAMPVWGEVFAEMLIDESRARQIAALRIQALAEHVRSLRTR
jgi:mono/diheme cytochrome c family protein